MTALHNDLPIEVQQPSVLNDASQKLKIFIFADNASMNMGGEAVLALYYFDRLRERNHDVWMVCHARVKSELHSRYDQNTYNRISFIEDSSLQKFSYPLTKRLPTTVRDGIIGQISNLITQLKGRSIVKKFVKEQGIDIVFAPSVISPKAISCLYNLGAPVVIGPMCGGIDFPPCFQNLESTFTRLYTYLGRSSAYVLNTIFPGKLKAAALLVANQQTARALPPNCTGRIYEVVEAGVDLSIWQPAKSPERDSNQPIRFVYMARFVEHKGIPFLIEAFSRVAQRINATLDLIGNGELFDSIKARVKEFNLQDQVVFHGRLALKDAAEVIQQCDVYLVPSIRECGGCATLEAMAMGLPVIAANWAGPGAYIDDKSGIRVDVPSREAFVQGLAEAMVKLATSATLREQLGQGSLQRVRENYFDWDSKVDRIVEIFHEVLRETKQRTIAPANRLKSRRGSQKTFRS